MLKRLSSVFCGVMLAVMLMPVQAQDEVDCSAGGINSAIDMLYNNFLADRSEVEASDSLTAAAALEAEIEAILEACEFSTDGETAIEEVEQTGDGSEGNPFVIQAPGTVGDTTITITRDVRPASELLAEAGVSTANNVAAGEEYVVIFVTVTCSAASQGGCAIGDNAFRLMTGSGASYAPTVDQFDDYFPASRNMIAGTERSGGIPFLIAEDAFDLRLVYYPDGNALDTGAQQYFYIAQGTTSDFEVTTTTSELIIRNNPNSGAAPVGAFRSGQTGAALGRTEDGLWIYVVTPEADGWVSAEFIESERDLASLQVLDADFEYEGE